MATDTPLTPAELRVWQSLGRLVHALPRALEDDMSRTGLTMTEFAALLLLESTPGHRRRMSELADAVGLTPSRITRVVDALSRHGLVRKERHGSDGRGNEAVLTDRGLAALQAAQPAHLASARTRVVDHVAPAQLDELANTLERILSGLDTRDR